MEEFFQNNPIGKVISYILGVAFIYFLYWLIKYQPKPYVAKWENRENYGDGVLQKKPGVHQHLVPVEAPWVLLYPYLYECAVFMVQKPKWTDFSIRLKKKSPTGLTSYNTRERVIPQLEKLGIIEKVKSKTGESIYYCKVNSMSYLQELFKSKVRLVEGDIHSMTRFSKTELENVGTLFIGRKLRSGENKKFI